MCLWGLPLPQSEQLPKALQISCMLDCIADCASAAENRSAFAEVVISTATHIDVFFFLFHLTVLKCRKPVWYAGMG